MHVLASVPRVPVALQLALLCPQSTALPPPHSLALHPDIPFHPFPSPHLFSVGASCMDKQLDQLTRRIALSGKCQFCPAGKEKGPQDLFWVEPGGLHIGTMH